MFSDDFFQSLSLRFAALTSSRDSGSFDAPFSYNELVAPLSRCHDSAPGADGLPYSAFKVSFPWWRHLLLSFSNLILRFAVVPSSWKSSLVVPLERPRLLRLLSSHISRLLCFQSLRASGPRSHRTTHFSTVGRARWFPLGRRHSGLQLRGLRESPPSGPHLCCLRRHQESLRLLLGRSHVGASPRRGHLRSSLAPPCQFLLRHSVPGPSGRLGFPAVA